MFGEHWIFNNTNTTHTNCTSGLVFENGYTIIEPSLVPTCILAEIIGIYCGRKIAQTNVRGSVVYSITMYMYATMMTFAMLADCLVSWDGLFRLVLEFIDVTLTSSVALSFAFNGLVDVGWIDENYKTMTVMFVAYLGTSVPYLYAYFTNWGTAYNYIYFCSVGISCGLYVFF